MLYGPPSNFEFPNSEGVDIDKPNQGLLLPNKTLPPTYVINTDVLDCENLIFDAICQHTVSGETRTYAFFDYYYAELSEHGLQMVKTFSTIVTRSSN